MVFSFGGEYTGANPLAMEYAPKEKRGKWAAFIHTGSPLSLAAISLVTTGLLRVLRGITALALRAVGLAHSFFSGRWQCWARSAGTQSFPLSPD